MCTTYQDSPTELGQSSEALDRGEATEAAQKSPDRPPTLQEIDATAEHAYELGSEYWQTNLAKDQINESFIFMGETHATRRTKLKELDSVVTTDEPTVTAETEEERIVTRMELLITQAFADLASYKNQKGELAEALRTFSMQTTSRDISILQQVSEQVGIINESVTKLGTYLTSVGEVMKEYQNKFPEKHRELFSKLFDELRIRANTTYDPSANQNYEYLSVFEAEAAAIAGTTGYQEMHEQLQTTIKSLQESKSDVMQTESNATTSSGDSTATSDAAPEIETLSTTDALPVPGVNDGTQETALEPDQQIDSATNDANATQDTLNQVADDLEQGSP